MKTHILLGTSAGRARAAACLASAAVVSLYALACSVVVDGSAEQCQSDDDCSDFPGTLCKDNLCVTPDAPCATNAECVNVADGACIDGLCRANVNTCATTAECVAANGEFNVCKNPVAGIRECVALRDPDGFCREVHGNWSAENAVFIGSVLPIGDVNAGTGLSTQNGAFLAVDEIEENASGLPALPGGAPRPIVLVSCNGEDRAGAVVAGTYLTDTVGVQAILGASFSGITIELATKVTIPKGVLLISSSATSTSITDIQDTDPKCVEACAGNADCVAGCPGLLWRTSPNDLVQGGALTQYLPIAEARVRAALDLGPADDIRVAILHKGDAYGEGLSKRVEQGIRYNGNKPPSAQPDRYMRAGYGDPDDADNDPLIYSDVVNDARDFKPHVVYDLGTEESIYEIMVPLEEAWDEPTFRPVYVFGDGGFVPDLVAGIECERFNPNPNDPEDLYNPEFCDRRSPSAQDELRSRIRGSVPGTTAEANPLFGTFVTSYRFPQGEPEIFGAAGAYDAVYLLAFSAASAGTAPLTGAQLARGFSRVVPPGSQIDVGPERVNAGFGVMTNPAGGNIDFRGASGPLDFNLLTGEADSDVLIWCLRRNDDNENELVVDSGLLYVTSDDAIVGNETNCN